MIQNNFKSQNKNAINDNQKRMGRLSSDAPPSSRSANDDANNKNDNNFDMHQYRKNIEIYAECTYL